MWGSRGKGGAVCAPLLYDVGSVPHDPPITRGTLGPRVKSLPSSRGPLFGIALGRPITPTRGLVPERKGPAEAGPKRSGRGNESSAGRQGRPSPSRRVRGCRKLAMLVLPIVVR